MNADAQTKVVVVRGEDKFASLDQVLTQSQFYDVLDRHWQGSGKDRADFLITVKPNIMQVFEARFFRSARNAYFVSPKRNE